MRLVRKSKNLAEDNMSIKSSVSFLDRMPFRRKRESFMAGSAIELSIPQAPPQPPAAELEPEIPIVPVTNLENYKPASKARKIAKAAKAPPLSFSLDIPFTSTEFFPSTIEASRRPATAIPEKRAPEPVPEVAVPEQEEEPELNEVEAPEQEDSYFADPPGFSSFSPTLQRVSIRSFSPSLVPPPLHLHPALRDSERTYSMTSIQPSIFHVRQRTPTIDSIPESMTSASSARSSSGTPPPSTPISTAPTSPAPTFATQASPYSSPPTPQTPSFTPAPKSPESMYASPAVPRQSRQSMIAPDPDSPLILTLTSKYPTGAAAALYVPEDCSLPRGVKPTTGGRLKAKMGLMNLRSATQKPTKPTTQTAPMKPAVQQPMKPAPAPVARERPVARPATATAKGERQGLNVLSKVASAGSSVAYGVKSNASVLRKRPQSISSKQEKDDKWLQVERMLEEMGRHPLPKSEKKVDKTWAGMMGV